jgi:hypothetical protein
MSTLPTDLRNKLERTCIAARNLAERAAKAALEALAVHHHEPYGSMTPAQRTLRNQLRARARQHGDTQDAKGQLSINHIAQECAYEHWHRMLFARFLAENNLLMLIEDGEKSVAVSLEECKELAKEAKTDLWTLAGRYAQTMLPDVFRADDPVLQVPMAREDQLKLEELLDALAKDTFTASDSLGWCYQFWQAERKDQVNAAGNKIGADELPSVTQLFTEDYMVDFLLDNTLGAWHAGKVLAANPRLAENAKSEEELRKAVALPGCPWKYLRFIKGKDGKWTPAAGTFDGWPKTAKELKCLDPCMGSGHFVVAMFERLVALRMAEEKLDEAAAVQAAIRENIFGLELDPRCTQIGAFSLALAAWRRVGHCALPAMHIACSGLAPNTREADWLKLAGDSDKLQRGMARLYRLFKDAPVLGSLINPHAGGDLLEAGFQELRPLLEKALVAEKTTGYLREGVENPTDLEMAVTAQGIAKAAEILAGQFTLVATNVPYLGRAKQDEVLQNYSERVHPDAAADLATCFVDRSVKFCGNGGSSALVTPQNWLFLRTYKHLRKTLLEDVEWNAVARLGARAFETIGGEVVNVALLVHSRKQPSAGSVLMANDVSDSRTPGDKAVVLREGSLLRPSQAAQLQNPDSIIQFETIDPDKRVGKFGFVRGGTTSGDSPCFRKHFWEVDCTDSCWVFQQGTVDEIAEFGGRELVLLWENGKGELAARTGGGGATIAGRDAWGKLGVAITYMSGLKVTRYQGEPFENVICVLIPKNSAHLPALWAFASSDEFEPAVRSVNQKLSVDVRYFEKAPFDLEHWQKVAAEKYPHGLPKPFSSDPTQWLFNGHPKAADQPLQVAVARLVGYQWPRQTGSSFPDCPALGPDGLEKLADDDGIVCLPSVRGESPAAERVRQLLQAAYGKDWKAHTELELIRASGSDAADLEEWLRNDFFEQHCDIFQQRPFVWHIWDGRKRDGFHALVNYHKLANGDQGRRTLESLTHSYLGDWITRQKHGVDPKHSEEGADERLAAALALKETLEAIIEGQGDPRCGDPIGMSIAECFPGLSGKALSDAIASCTGKQFDVFVRWKPLAQQAVGWNPDINDGVRMNIRPFLASDIPGGKKGAGILRVKPNIKWDKDRGKEPKRDKAEYPWFWNGAGFTGDRVNDVHLTKEQKEKAK